MNRGFRATKLGGVEMHEKLPVRQQGHSNSHISGKTRNTAVQREARKLQPEAPENLRPRAWMRHVIRKHGNITHSEHDISRTSKAMMHQDAKS